MYKKYELYDNPFKLENDHEVVGTTQNQTFNEILEFLSRKASFERRSGNRFIAALKGDYGAGKSFFQIKLSECIEKKDFRYKKYIQEDIKIVVSRFSMLDQNKRLPSNSTLHLYQRIVSYLGSDGRQFFFDAYNSLEKTAKEKKVEISKLLSDLSPQFRKAICSMQPDAEDEFIAWKWISGQRLTGKELERLGVNYYINTPDLAEKQIFQLLKLLKILDYGLLLICIDEVEEIWSLLSEKQYFKVMGMLKEIFDRYEEPTYSRLKPLTPIGFLCSMTEDAWEVLQRAGEEREAGMTAVVTRIGEATFIFERFNDQDAEDFIKVLLAKKRMDGYKKDPLMPFDKDSVKLINEVSYGNPRDITQRCDQLLERAIKEKESKIDVKFTTKYLSGIGAGSISLPDSEEPIDTEKI